MSDTSQETHDFHENDLSILPSDHVTIFNHLGFRVVLTFISWIVLGFNVSAGKSFFVSTFLFVFPLLLDYLKFTPHNNRRVWLKNVGTFVTIAFCLVSVFGLFEIFDIKNMSGGLILEVSNKFIAMRNASIPLVYLWYCFGACVFLTVFDWVVSTSPLEKAGLNRSKTRQEDVVKTV